MTARKKGSKRKKFHIKTGDTVYVIAGEEKGKTGKVLRVLRDENKAIVENLNMVKKHARPSPENPAGGIVEMEAPIHVSNLMLYDTVASKPTRIGRKTLSSGEKVRYSKASGEEI